MGRKQAFIVALERGSTKWKLGFHLTYFVDPLIECSKLCIRVDNQVNKLMRRRNLPARGTLEHEPACTVQIWPPNCIVPLQIAQVQISTELLEVCGMDSKDSS